MKSIAFCLRLALLASVCALTARAELKEESTATFKSGGIELVDLTNTNGRIQVEAWEKEEIEVFTVKRAKEQADMDAIQVDLKREEGKVKAVVRHQERQKKGWFFNRMVTAEGSVEFKVKLPSRMALSARTTNGSIEARGLNAAASLSSVNGSVKAFDMGGDTRLNCVNGEIESLHSRLPADLPVRIRAETVNGSVHIRSAVGGTAAVEASTVNGKFSNELPKPAESATPTFRIDAKTVNGSIRVTRE